MTFGSPPVTLPDLTPNINGYLSTLESLGISVAVVNGQDIITRCDKDYFLSLVELYQQIGRPVVAAERALTGKDIRPRFDLRPSKNHLLGSILVLKNMNPDEAELDLCAGQLSTTAFGDLLFCNANMHEKNLYLSRIERSSNGPYRCMGSNPLSYVL